MDARQKFYERDRVTNALSEDGLYRAVFVNNKTALLTARRRHGLTANQTAFLGRTMAASTMLASFLKGEERVDITLQGDRGIETVYGEAIQVGEVRGYVAMSEGKSDETGGVSLGKGVLRVQRIIYGRYKPIAGVVQLQKGDVTSDLEHYLEMSEQTPSAMVLEVDDADQEEPRSMGLLLQAMPGADLEQMQIYASRIKERGLPLQVAGEARELLEQVLPFPFEVTGSTPLDFFCRCSAEHFEQWLLPLGIDELEDMKRQGPSELTCQYCSEKYILSVRDIQALIDELKKRGD